MSSHAADAAQTVSSSDRAASLDHHVRMPSTRNRTRQSIALFAIVCLAIGTLGGCAVVATERATTPPTANTSRLGASPAQLDPEHWIARQPDASRRLLDDAAIAAQNARLLALDPSLHDLAALPATLSRSDVESAIRALSVAPTRTLFDASGAMLSPATIDTLVDALALDTIPPETTPGFALVTQRADLRTFPTATRVFSRADDIDIDRFQESALFPGTPVAVLHGSRDGAWRFVASTTYRAWIRADALALGTRDEVLGYATRTPFRIVTGATAHTAFTRHAPQVSRLQLDMGVRVPLRDWPHDAPVHGQHPQGSHVIDLPMRAPDGTLAFAPALLPAQADSSASYLPLTYANLLHQAFKFLGEPYGWGHSDGTRDCSGFVSEVYRSFGLLFPRNTGDQAKSPALQRIGFDAGDDHARRLDVLRTLAVGDLVYVPGHVMMVVGHEHGHTYVIHDTAGVHVDDGHGTATRVHVHGVVVTLLEPLLAEDGSPLVDRITAIQRVPRDVRTTTH